MGRGEGARRVIPWTRAEERWRGALMAAMIPAAPPHGGLGSVPLEGFWASYQLAAPPLLRFGLRATVVLLTVLAPLLLLGKPHLFPSLSPDNRDRLLERAASSRFYLVRQLVMTLKVLATFAFLRDPATRAAVEASP